MQSLNRISTDSETIPSSGAVVHRDGDREHVRELLYEQLRVVVDRGLVRRRGVLKAVREPGDRACVARLRAGLAHALRLHRGRVVAQEDRVMRLLQLEAATCVAREHERERPLVGE